MALLRKFSSISLLTVLTLSLLAYGLKFPMVRFGSSIDLPDAYPFVYVYPDLVNADVGQTFTIAVIVYNLTDATIVDPENPFLTIPLGNMYGFDLQFTWDPTVIKYVNSTNPSVSYGGYHHPNVITPVEKWPDPVPPSPYAGILHGFGTGNLTLLEVKNVVNETGNIVGAADPSVRAWFAYATMLPAWTFNGNGTLFTMTFKVLKSGASPLNIVDLTLANIDGYPIGKTTSGQWLNPILNGMFRTLLPPVANFTHWPEVGKINETMHFDASTSENSTNIIRYEWNFGDGTKQNTTIPTVDHIYGSGGTFPASLKVVDVDGRASNTTTHNIQVIGTLQISEIRMTSILKAEANITCPGVGDVTQLVDTVTLNFLIDGTWYSKPMTYNSTTRLYSALLPAYNQLAKKAVNYYVVVRDKEDHYLSSSVIIHNVPDWVIADLNRDGRVSILDIVIATTQYAKP